MSEIALYRIRLLEDWLRDRSPPWFQGPEAGPQIEGHGRLLDEHAEWVATAIRARHAELAPEDALNLLGAERGLTRYPGESLETWRDRVLGAWEFWTWAGTEHGMQTALAQLGYSSAIVPRWLSVPADWSEFDVFIYPARRSFDGSPAERHRILSIIGQVKAGHTRLRQLTYVSFGPLTWDPPGLTWDPPGQVWGDAPVQLFP
ncbi:phage tail protein [uncultured Meiothermus sp.]|jgi:hypothetical protein|uniref:phage tail protein n=1 Tax=uncultured Meiothermus sp. TaxID=157471 RepID=UPI00261952C7|nr:phage tail protein [uncultured Meiothermus sp.]